jgi:hypothetical protein
MLWAYLAWSVAEFVDDVQGSPGTFANMVSEAIRWDRDDQ